MVEIGHNSNELTDEQLESLFHHHKRLYANALAAKKKADADFKNTCKRAKSESVDPKMIAFALELEGDKDGRLEQERAEKERIARWMGAGYGEQLSLLDRTPGEDRAGAEGFRAGAAGESRNSPYSGILEAAWLDGWTRGQKSLQSSLSLFEERAKAAAEDDGPEAEDGDELAVMD